jgi:hypothetical protein
MNDNPTSRQLCARTCPGRRAARGGFSVCLFIVVLAVFGWVMHRRLTQYDTLQQAVHQSTAIKACLTKRNPIALPSMRGVGAFAVFFFAFAVIATLGNSEASVALRVQRGRRDRLSGAQIRPNLARFYFLPPPSLPTGS